MKQILSALVIISGLYACKSKTNLVTNATIAESQIPLVQDSIAIEIEALDLSEDMSRISSKNDEILIIIYELETKKALEKPLYSTTKVVSSSDRVICASLSLDTINQDSEVLFIILEQDSEIPLEQIDAIFRVHFEKITEAFDHNNYQELERYLGDEDLLGYKIIKGISDSSSFDFRGIYKLDNYHYQVRIVN